MNSPDTEEKNRRQEKYAGMGLVFGAGIGLVIGDMIFASPILGLATGAVIGLVFGPGMANMFKDDSNK